MTESQPDFLRGRKTLDQLLTEYKSRGCTILLTGDVPTEIFDAASANLLGDPRPTDSNPHPTDRKRVFGLFDRAETIVHDRLERTGYGRTPTRVVTTDEFARQTATHDGGTEPTAQNTPSAPEAAAPYCPDRSLDVTKVAGTDLTAIRDALETAFDAAEPTNGYQPAELRVCIDSLRPLLESCDAEQVAAFTAAVTTAITDRDGMGHFVLPIAHDSDLVADLESQFDIVAPLRAENGTSEQRWEFIAESRKTEWFDL